ncbi:GNAT family N-acetyltransferase [Nereida sp. MMG025]|uniref:GNAT family N-acetyltransferase n=1 Tax=Nereida sp. MMG025 TaxID=2909981 RepID=UPI001F32A946|nr:GNAT family N-acetyltransferase [Nereida sp. MMG025]MCF6445052.1 GNAT family N-acetyltransferase [Nereida sp. MMG025]
MSQITVRAIEQGDKAEWSALYAAYARFYEVDQTEKMRETVWSWLNDPDHEVSGLCAIMDGALVGIAHVRPFARPLAASKGLYLDDLFVSEAARGTGAAAALIEALKPVAKDCGATVIRWITAQDNARARAFYDHRADATEWVTYDIDL